MKYIKLFTISLFNSLERFSFAGLKSVLLLYLIKILNIEMNHAQKIYGTFDSLSYLVACIGGGFINQFIQTKDAILISNIIILIGNIFLYLSSENLEYIIYSLAIIATGTGIFKSNCINIVYIQYQKSNFKEDWFRFYYTTNNIIVFFSPIIICYAFMIKHEYTFLVGVISIFLSVIIFISEPSAFQESIKTKHTNSSNITCVILILFTLIYINTIFIKHWYIFTKIISISIVLSIIYIYYIIKQCHLDEKFNIIQVIFTIIVNSIFTIFISQASKIFIIFCDQYVNMHLFQHIKLSAGILESIDPLTVVFFTPILLYSNSINNIYELKNKIYICCLLTFISFISLYLVCILNSNQESKISIIFPIFSFICLIIIEIILIPSTFYIVNKLSPVKYRDTFIGLIFYYVAIGNYISSLIFSYIQKKSYTNIVSLDIYKQVFLSNVYLVVLIFILIYIIYNFILEKYKSVYFLQ